MKLRFTLSDDLRQDVFVQTGQQLPKQTTIDVPNTEFTPDERRFLLRLDAHATNEITLKIPGQLHGSGSGVYSYNDDTWESPLLPEGSNEWHQLLTAYSAAYVQRVQENDRFRQQALDVYIPKLEARVASPEPIESNPGDRLSAYQNCEGYERAIALIQQLVDRYEARQQEIKQDAQRRERMAKEEKERLEHEKDEWIAQYGSSPLRKKFQAGYNCQRDYAFERVRTEHPDYLLDFKDDAAWNERSCPSDAAFAEAERVGGRVVYLTKLPSSAPEYDSEYYDFEGCEAVIIPKYLGKYDLIRTF